MSGFSIIKRDIIKFNHEGLDLTAIVRRPTGREQVKFEAEVSRLHRVLKEKPEEGGTLVFELYLDYLSTLVLDLKPLEDDTQYPKDPEERKEFFNQAGWKFVQTLTETILSSGNLTEKEEGK